MALIVITLNDTDNGEVNVGFQSEPAFSAVVGAPVSPAQRAAQFMLTALQMHMEKSAKGDSKIVLPN